MEDKLTKQDKVFVKNVVETGNLTKSVQEAYDIDDPKYASVKGQRLIAKDRIKNAIQTLADRIPDDKLHEVLMEGLEAGKKVFKNNNASGKVEEVATEPDYATRHKYLDTALKLKGAYEEEPGKKVVIVPVLVKFLNKKDDETSDNGNTQ